MKEKSEYDIQAEKFLEKTGTTIDIKFLKHDKHFADDKEERDIYDVKLKRKNRSMTITFGNSLNDSGFKLITVINTRNIPIGDSSRQRFIDSPNLLRRHIEQHIKFNLGNKDKIKLPVAPNAYSILACLTKYDPETFEDFCSEFDYNTDSRKAEETYNAVKEEWLKVCSLFSDEELSELQEIS